ncbi:hypothetical protein [Sphingomonas sp. NPDC079357]|uniref:hypothetical protein n=1 Tax=Sphingomonas sp. NPDC079357 TaxID=3364518 RepID=UPI003850D1D1
MRFVRGERAGPDGLALFHVRASVSGNPAASREGPTALRNFYLLHSVANGSDPADRDGGHEPLDTLKRLHLWCFVLIARMISAMTVHSLSLLPH